LIKLHYFNEMMMNKKEKKVNYALHALFISVSDFTIFINLFRNAANFSFFNFNFTLYINKSKTAILFVVNRNHQLYTHTIHSHTLKIFLKK